MRREGSRSLTPEEANLWKRATRRTTVLHPDRPKPWQDKDFRAAPERSVHQPIPEFRIGEKSGNGDPSHDPVPDVSRYSERLPSGMDRKIHGKLKRGKLAPEARIDLHGLTSEGAFFELDRFIPKAHADGCRLVLVITGKGRKGGGDGSTPFRGGVLKRMVPLWLASSPFSRLVLDVSEAHPRHGGSGAYYVYLRRRDNRGGRFTAVVRNR